MTIYYDSSIVKVNKDGATVLATTLEKGEKLIDGSTYRDEEVRLRGVNSPSRFAQSSMTEHNNPEDPAPGLTLDPTGTSTIRQGDDATPAGDLTMESIAPVIATTTDDGNSTQVVPNPDKPEKDIDEGGEVQFQDAPKESDSKREWYDYAVTKGLDTEYDDITKNDIIAYVNDQD